MVTADTGIRENAPLGTGFYTVPEAARLLRIRPRNINRWLGGYTFRNKGVETSMDPLWLPELPTAEDHIELGFRDLIELKFVDAFLAAGVDLRTVRNCIEIARECVNDDRPFSTRKFLTDGRSIFLESLQRESSKVLDLKRRQYVFKTAIEQTFRDLDIDDETVTSWRPFKGKRSIVVDPKRSFGQPVSTEYGVPTVALAEAVEAEGSIERVAYLYEVPPRMVREAMEFETYLHAA